MADLSEGSEYSEYSEYSEDEENPQGGFGALPVMPMIGPDGNPIMPTMPAMPGMNMPSMPMMLGPDGQPMPMMNFNLPPMVGPDGQALPMSMPMLDPNGQPMFPMPMMGPDGNPLPMPGLPGMNVAPMVGPDGQALPNLPAMPPMLGPDGNPLPMPTSGGSGPSLEEFMRSMLNLQVGTSTETQMPAMPAMPGMNMMPMLGPDGQPMPMFPMPMMGPDGNPLPMPGMPGMPMMPMIGPDGQPMPMIGPDGNPIPFAPMGMDPNTQSIPSQEEEEEEDESYTDDLSGEPIDESSEETTPKEIEVAQQPETPEASPQNTATPTATLAPTSAPTSTSTLESVSQTPAKIEPKEIGEVDIEKALSTLSTRAALLQTVTAKGKRDAAKVDKKQKLISKIPAKQEQELAQYKEKSEVKVKAAQSKMELEFEKVKQTLDRELKSYEKQQVKTLKEHDAQYEEITRTTNQKQDKLMQTTESALQASRKEAKDAYTKEKNAILAEQKDEISSKKRKKATYDKKYMKQLKVTHKNILLVAEKIHLTELEYLKKSSDLELQQQQQSISCDLVEQTNKEIFLNKLKMLQEKNSFDLEQYSSLMLQKLDLLQAFHMEQIQVLKLIHDLERRLMERRFKDEGELQQILVQAAASSMKKDGKTKQQIEAETSKLTKLTTEELEKVKKEQESLLEARLQRELEDMEFSHKYEVYELKLETTKQKVEMAKGFHKEEKDLLIERKGKDLHSLQEGHADMTKNNVDAQKELFDFLGQKKSEIELILKDIMEEHREKTREKIVAYFQNKNRLLATTFKAKNAVQQRRQENATVALTETYDIRLQNLEEKSEQEMREHEESVSALEACEPKR